MDIGESMSSVVANKNILITGASRGLGLAIAQAMWREGANLFLVARSGDKLSQLRDELVVTAKKNQKVEIVAADLAEPQVISHIMAEVGKHHHQIDILVNNAAIQGPIGPILENDWHSWQKTIQVNLMASIALCRACLLPMIKSGRGKIINLSGGGATTPRPNFSAYAVSKVGLVRFSETLAEEVREFNIDVNCIAPGMMNSELLAEVVEAGPDRAGRKEYEQAVERQKNSSIPDRAVELCLYLASAASDGLTGKLISAVWDPWQSFSDCMTDLRESDIYTLRRIIPVERGKTWG